MMRIVPDAGRSSLPISSTAPPVAAPAAPERGLAAVERRGAPGLAACLLLIAALVVWLGAGALALAAAMR